MNEYKRHHQTSINVQKQANLIWNVANILRGLYKPHEYGKVILPMTVIKRLHDTLLKTREEVLKTAENTQSMNDVMRENFLKNASGYSFYNTSLYTFETLLADPANIESNFRAYLNGFSENMQDILDNFKFDVEITTMSDNDALFYVIQEFNKADAYLGPDKMTSTDMGYVFEELVRKFSESYNEEAGAHFTSRDIIYLMTDLLLIEDKDTLFKEHVFKTVYDQTMGTSQMLSAMTERIHDMNDTAEVATFIQEIMASPSLIQSVVQQVNEIRKGKSENDIKVTIDYHRSRYEEIVNKRDRLIDIIASDETLRDMLTTRIRSFTQEIEEIELAIESLQFEIKQQDEQVDSTVVSTILEAMFSEIGRLTKTELKELYLLTLDSIHFEKCENKKKLYQLNIMVNQSVLDTLFNGQQFDEQLLDCSSFCFSPIILPFEFKA